MESVISNLGQALHQIGVSAAFLHVPLLPVCFQLVDDGTDVRDYLEERKK
jgi:hypothetical protein